MLAAVILALVRWVSDRPTAVTSGAKGTHAISTPSGLSRPARVDQSARLAFRIPTYPSTTQVGTFERSTGADKIQLCQCVQPSAPCPIYGVDSAVCSGCFEPTWSAFGPLPWQPFAHGEFVGPSRTANVWRYRLRVGDRIDFVYRLTRHQMSTPYELNVGDEIRVESLADATLDRNLTILSDGTITLRLLGQVPAARQTVEQLRADLEEKYKKYYKVPSITVTPVKVNTRLEDLRAVVDKRAGAGGQSISTTVSDDGTVQLPALLNVPAQGLTLQELKTEIDERYAQEVQGIEVTPVLIERAPRYAFVLGEVQTPGRFELTGPTTVMQSIALAGGWKHGGKLRHVVIFRRAEDWRLLATRLDLAGALHGERPCPADEIWVRDSDLILVPKSLILRADEVIDLVFTQGVYSVFPFHGISISMSKLSTI